jgi:hypothetical protein
MGEGGYECVSGDEVVVSRACVGRREYGTLDMVVAVCGREG